MSQENVELIREGFAAFNRGDYDAALPAFHPDVEWHPYLGAVEGNIYRGREAIGKMWSDLEEGFGGSLRIEAREFVDLGDQVIAIVEAHGIGTASGAEVHQSWAMLASIQDGMIFRVEPFPDKPAALEAAGLRE